MEWLHYTRKILSRQMCDSAPRFFLSSNKSIKNFVSRGDEVIFLFSLVPSCHEEMCLRRRRINCAPPEHNFNFCTIGAQVEDETSPPVEEKLPTSHPPARKLTYARVAHKFSLSASVVVSLARRHLRLGRFRLCVFEFGFFFRIEKILALQLFAAHLFLGFNHFSHHA